MKSSVLLAAASASAFVFLAGCASQPEAPAPVAAPAPAPKPAPAPEPSVRPAAPAPAPMAQTQAAPPAPAAPKKPAVVNLASTELFEFNKAVLSPEARAKLDQEVLARLSSMASIRYIIVNGHADRLGDTPYNQKLSERRAEAVRAYLVSRGTDAAMIETLGFGKTLPVKSCPNQPRAQLIECLAPNRRVVVEVQGTPR